MNDAQRYRMKAVEYLSAAERCGPVYRCVALSIAETWLSLARHEDAMDRFARAVAMVGIPEGIMSWKIEPCAPEACRAPAVPAAETIGLSAPCA
jgi:hypothetical protein